MQAKSLANSLDLLKFKRGIAENDKRALACFVYGVWFNLKYKFIYVLFIKKLLKKNKSFFLYFFRKRILSYLIIFKLKC